MKHFFGEWTNWVLEALSESKIFLCVDEIKISSTMVSMVIGVAWSERCIPLAWGCYNPKEYPSEGQVKVIKQLLPRNIVKPPNLFVE